MDDKDRGGLLALFVDGLPDLAMVLLDVDGKILSWNVGAGLLIRRNHRPELFIALYDRGCCSREAC